MRYAVIDSGVVENVIEADPSFGLEGKTLVQSDTAQIGWLYDGQNFTDPNPPSPAVPVVPSQVTARQARRALAATPAPGGGNMKTIVDNWVAQQSSDIQIDWEYSTEINRASGTVISAAQALGLTSAQLDQLFTLAATFT